jgi:maltose O-acetyltransferase
MKCIHEKIHAYWRSFAPLSCLFSPRNDVVSGLRKWRWLASQRRAGALVDPSVDLRCNASLRERLVIHRAAAIDRGAILWISDDCGVEAKITLGERAYVGPYTFLGSCHHLEIGSDTLVGGGSYLITANHRTEDPSLPYADQGYRGGDVRIGCNVWLGARVIVLPGVTIGDNAVVGAGAVVTKDIPAGQRWVGIPARSV